MLGTVIRISGSRGNLCNLLLSKRINIKSLQPSLISYVSLDKGYCQYSTINCLNATSHKVVNRLIKNTFSFQVYHSTNSLNRELDSVSFDNISNETLESLSEYFEELIEEATHLKDADVSYGDGVLTIKFGNEYGTYVINRQTPNKQIWLSSPISGPKRYDFIGSKWMYRHDGKTLHELLNTEIPNITQSKVVFEKCPYGGADSN